MLKDYIGYNLKKVLESIKHYSFEFMSLNLVRFKRAHYKLAAKKIIYVRVTSCTT